MGSKQLNIGDRLRERRKELKLNQSDIGAQIGSDAANVSRMERGLQSINDELLAAWLKALDLTLKQEIHPTTDVAQEPRTVYDAASQPPSSRRHVPIVGTTTGGTGGFWEELGYPPGHGDGYLDVPSNDATAYGLRVKGSSMSPRIYEGEVLLVEPGRQCNPGDDVVVKTTDGQIMVKVLIARRGGEITLGSISNGDRLVFDQGQIASMHFVAGVFRPGVIKDN